MSLQTVALIARALPYVQELRISYRTFSGRPTGTESDASGHDTVR